MTLKDIANECGVSMMTVSNVISGNHKKVSAATIEKVNAVIKKYDYVPNLMARTLSSKSSHLILLVLPYTDSEQLFSIHTQYLTELIASIEHELMENGYYALFRSVKDAKEIEVMYRTWNIDGAIFLFPFFDKIVTEVKDYQKKNFVLIDSYISIPDVLYSRCDDSLGCYRATEYLIQKGHTKILFAAEHTNNLLLEKRFAGYKKALEDHGIPFTEDRCPSIQPNYENGKQFGRSLTKENLNFTAIVTTGDMCAFGIIEGAKENGLSVPNDFSIIGFDNLFIGNFSQPRLTSIDQQISEKGKHAVTLLLNRLNGKEQAPIRQTETKLEIRDSVRKL